MSKRPTSEGTDHPASSGGAALGVLLGAAGAVSLAACGSGSSRTSGAAPSTSTTTTTDGSTSSTAAAVTDCTEIPEETGGPYPADGTNGPNVLTQETDADRNVRFTSIFPACYSGRWPHVHFEVYRSLAEAQAAGTPTATSQLAFPEDVCNTVFAESGYEQSVRNFSGLSLTSDMVFGDDGGAHQIGTATGSVVDGHTATLQVGV